MGNPDISGPVFAPLEAKRRSKQPRFLWNGKERRSRLSSVGGFSLPPSHAKPRAPAGSPRAAAGPTARGSPLPAAPEPAAPGAPLRVCWLRVTGEAGGGGADGFSPCFKTLGKTFGPALRARSLGLPQPPAVAAALRLPPRLRTPLS